MKSLPWIEPNSLANARKLQEHDVAAESTTGPFGGQGRSTGPSGATFAVECCLSWMSAESRKQTATPEATSETCVASFHSFSEKCYPFLLNPFWLFGLFFFSFIFTLAFILSSAVGPVPQENYHLELLVCVRTGFCMFSSLLSPSVLNISSSCTSSL